MQNHLACKRDQSAPKIEFFGIDSNKMRKNGVLDRVLKKHEFHWTFDAKIQRPEMEQKRVWQVTCCNLRGLGGYGF